jgi:hypothetical protein
MQLFLVCSVMVFVLRKSERAGLILWAALFTVSTVTLIAIATYYDVSGIRVLVCWHFAEFPPILGSILIGCDLFLIA